MKTWITKNHAKNIKKNKLTKLTFVNRVILYSQSKLSTLHIIILELFSISSNT